MMVNTSELIGDALDWIVAECKGWKVEFVEPGYIMFSGDLEHHRGDFCAPSTDLSQGGQILFEEGISSNYSPSDTGETPLWAASDRAGLWLMEDDEPLIAGMRCFVASKRGDQVEVPDWLFKFDPRHKL